MAKVESADSLLAEANALFVDELFSEALVKYNEAIELDDKSSDLFTKRSFCHFKLSNFTQSMSDAKKAIDLDSKNAKAWFRKGAAAFSLEEYESAKQAFEKSQELAPSATNKTWIRKCEAEIADEGGKEDADSESSEDVNVMMFDAPPPLEEDEPTTNAPTKIEPPKPSQPTPAPAPTTAPAPTPTPTPTPAPAPTATPTPAAQSKPQIRHEWYQTEAFVTVSVMAKGVKKEDAVVNIGQKLLEVCIKLPSGSEFQLNLELADEVVPAESKYEILSTKIEIKMKKLRAAKWPALENTGGKVETWGSIADKDKTAKPALVYPSSSKKGEKNWEVLAAQVEEEKLEGEAALNQVFQNIYKGASDEQRRAMLKSFQESGGTVLSTNWDEVGKAPVKGSPPAGMEMRNWSDLEK